MQPKHIRGRVINYEIGQYHIYDFYLYVHNKVGFYALGSIRCLYTTRGLSKL